MVVFSTRDWEVKLKANSHPRELVVEVATTCNLDCVHCFRKSARGLETRVMSLELFERVLESAVEAGVEKVVFSGWGEPLTNPYVGEMIEACRDRGVKVAINTNGTLINKYLDVIAKYVDELYISLDAATVKTYSYIRKSASLDQVLQGLLKIIEIKRLSGSLKPTVKAVFAVMKTNIHEIGAFLEFAAKIGINEVVFTHTIPHSGVRSEECMDSEECIEGFSSEFSRVLGKLALELGVSITAPSKLGGALLSCPFAENRALFVRCDGAITPCINYAYSWKPRILGVEREVKEVILGNVQRDSLMDVWRGSYAKMLFKLHFKKMPSCLTCTLMLYCAKTRGNEVDCLGNSPTCGHCPYFHKLSFCPL